MACWALGLLVEEVLRGLAGLVDDAGGLDLRALGAGGAFFLRGGELGLHLVGVAQAGRDFRLALIERGEDGLEREFPEDESDDGKAEDLREDERHADAEIVRDLRDAAGGLAMGRHCLDGVAGGFSENEQGGEHGKNAGEGKGRAGAGRRREKRKELLNEEDRVERDGSGEGHADDGLDEDLAGRAGVAADAFDGLGADETDADGGGETTEGGMETAGDFCELGDHGGVIFVGWISAVRTRGTLPAGKG